MMLRLVLALVLCLAPLACGGGDESGALPSTKPAPEPVSEPASEPAPEPTPTPPAPPAPVPAPDPLADARATFQARCASCHGEHGAGDGPVSVGLSPKPRNFGDGAWQKSVTDAHIEKVISQGGASVGLSALMPPNPDLAADPAKLAGLRALVRSFGP